MKKLLLITILIISLLVTGVSASVDFSTTQLNLGSYDPGQTAVDSSVTLNNNEASALTYTFSGYALTLGSRSFNINTISDIPLAVQGAAGDSAALSISIPIPANQYAGAYQGSLTAAAVNQTSITQSLPITLMINSKPSVTATAASFKAGRGISRTNNNAFTISNTGNTDVNSFSITLSNDLSNGAISLNKNYVSFTSSSNVISYGGSVNVAVVTNIPAGQQTGIYTGQITITYGSQTATSPIQIEVRDPLNKLEVDNNLVEIGGPSQARNQTAVQKTFYIRNTGDYSEQATLALSGLSSSYHAQLSTTQISVSPGSSQPVTITLDIPDDEDSGKNNIGKLQLTYNQKTENIPVQLEVESRLEISKIETKINSKSSSSLTGDKDKLSKDLGLGDEVEFEIFVKNTYPSSYSSTDFKIEDIIITMEPADDDFDTVDNDGNEFYVKPNEEDKAKLTFSVPDQISDGEYDFKITVEGTEKESGALHTDTWTATISVQRERNDVRITESRLGTDALQCVRTTDLKVKIANFGYDDQDDAALTIYAPGLSINEQVQDIFLSEDFSDNDNDFTKTITISVSDNFKAGTYPVTIKAYRNTDTEMDQEIINLKVEDCPVPEPQVPVENTSVVITPNAGIQAGGQTTTGTSSNVVETVESSFTDSTAFILMLVGINLVILLVILVLVFKFLF